MTNNQQNDKAILLSASKIAAYALQDPQHPEIELAQVVHRIRLVQAWGIHSGARVLEIGCGQGNCTTVLAEAVGPTGYIDAIDPAPTDYGAPFTLAQAQAHIDASEVGGRITWHRAHPVELLESSGDGDSTSVWDYAVLSHCIWYFESPDTLRAILERLATRARNICVAEYALHASEPRALPHVLAALTRATLEAHKTRSTENIRSPLSPAGIKEIALSGLGLALRYENIIVPDVGLCDGMWEVGSVLQSGVLDDVGHHVSDERVALLIRSMTDSVRSAVDEIGGVKKVRTMDVWVAVFQGKT